MDNRTVVAIRLRPKKHLEPPALGEYVVAGDDGHVLIGPFQTEDEAREWITQEGIIEALTDDGQWEAVRVEIRSAVDKWGQLANFTNRADDYVL